LRITKSKKTKRKRKQHSEEKSNHQKQTQTLLQNSSKRKNPVWSEKLGSIFHYCSFGAQWRADLPETHAPDSIK
jgi:hypothetical protein